MRLIQMPAIAMSEMVVLSMRFAEIKLFRFDIGIISVTIRTDFIPPNTHYIASNRCRSRLYIIRQYCFFFSLFSNCNLLLLLLSLLFYLFKFFQHRIYSNDFFFKVRFDASRHPQTLTQHRTALSELFSRSDSEHSKLLPVACSTGWNSK